MTKILPGILAGTAILFIESAIAGATPEYTAAEARKHIGENATVVGTIDCIGHGRRHVDLQIGGCELSKAQLWIVLPNDATGPEVDPETLRGVPIAITGKIESSSGTPQITIKSTTDIQPRSALQTNYIGRAYDKETQGDLDEAMKDLEQAVEHQPARRDEACERLARVKEKRGDWAGALAAYDRLVSFDPNKSGSYWVRATAKEQHGDFEGAMADFTRAAELRSSAANFIFDIGNRRKAHGDLAGAMATYDKAIAMLDSQIAGMQKPSDRLDLLYYHRGYAKEAKGDIDGAIADYGQAIAIKPSYGAGAYSRRGDIKKARGDLAGAIADYQFAVKYAELNEDKEKLKKARAEAKTLAKNVATHPNIQATQNERSFNKSEVTPESIASAFVQAYSGANIDALASLYADRVDHTNSGVISNAAVRAQAKEYFARWPVRQWSLVGPVKTVSLGAAKQKVIFSATYDVSDPQTNKHTSGIAKETLTLATDASGAMKIVSQKEQTSKRNSSRSDEETSDDPRLKTAKAEYEVSSRDEAARIRYVTKLADIYKAELGSALAAIDVEHELRKHPMPRNVDSRKLSQLLIGKWESPRHSYVFRADGTYGMVDTDEKDKWRIDGNEYINDVSRGPIILVDRNYFIYAEGQGAAVYIRAKDSEAERNQSSAGTTTETESLQGRTLVEGNTASNNNAKTAGQKSTSTSSAMRSSAAVPTDAEVVDIPAEQAQFGIKAGNIKVTFADGHAETITQHGNCMEPHVSAKGDVGWTQYTSFDRKGYALNEKLIIRSAKGDQKEFKPDPKAPFIGAWTFVDGDSAVAIQSRSFHGPASFIRYDLATGKMTNKKDGRNDSEPPPEWARPLSN